MELIFEIRDAGEGGLYARALGTASSPQRKRGMTAAETADELRTTVIEAVSLHFEGAAARPRLIQMHYVKEELVPVEVA